MSAPIDELVISVEIDEGSNLEDLYNMLKELQQAGGKIEVEIPEEKFDDIGNKITAVNRRVGELVNTLKPLIEKFPNLESNLTELLEENFEEIIEFIKMFPDFKDGLFSKLDDIYKDLINKLEVISKATRNILSEETINQIKLKLEEIKQQCVLEQVTDILKTVTDLYNYRIHLKGHITIKSNEIIERLLELFNDLELQISNIYGAVLEIQSEEAVIKSIIGDIDNKIISLNEEIKSIQQEDFNEFISDLQEIIEAFFISQFDRIKEELRMININVLNSSTKRDADLIWEGISRLNEMLENKLEDVFRWETYIDGSIETLTAQFNKGMFGSHASWRSVITEQTLHALNVWKEKLDSNLKSILDSELNQIYESIEGIFEVRMFDDVIEKMDEMLRQIYLLHSSSLQKIIRKEIVVREEEIKSEKIKQLIDNLLRIASKREAGQREIGTYIRQTTPTLIRELNIKEKEELIKTLNLPITPYKSPEILIDKTVEHVVSKVGEFYRKEDIKLTEISENLQRVDRKVSEKKVMEEIDKQDTQKKGDIL